MGCSGCSLVGGVVSILYPSRSSHLPWHVSGDILQGSIAETVIQLQAVSGRVRRKKLDRQSCSLCRRYISLL